MWQLGHGDLTDVPSPRKIGGALTKVRVCKIAASADHSACVTEDGRLFVWGARGKGKLGLGQTGDALEPRQVVGVLAEEEVSASLSKAQPQTLNPKP